MISSLLSHNLRHCTGNCIQGQRKTMKIPSQKNVYPIRSSNLGPPDYETEIFSSRNSTAGDMITDRTQAPKRKQKEMLFQIDVLHI